MCGVIVFVSHSVDAQQVATIHVKGAYSLRDGVFIQKFFDSTAGNKMAIFVAKNNEAYFCWDDTLPVDRRWDSVFMANDSAIINRIKRIVTLQFVDSGKIPDVKTSHGYSAGVIENWVTKSLMEKDNKEEAKWAIIKQMLDEEYKKYVKKK